MPDIVIQLTPDELQHCITFSHDVAETEQPIEYGQTDTGERPVEEVEHDTLEGKVAEVAFQKLMLEHCGRTRDLDWRVYNEENENENGHIRHDNQDALINGWRIDVKATQSYSSYLLIELNKLNFRYQEHMLPHIFTMFTVDYNPETGLPTGRATYKGSATLKWMRDGEGLDFPPTIYVPKHDFIPGTNKQIQADNFAIHHNNLNKNLDGLNQLLNQSPDNTMITDFENYWRTFAPTHIHH